MSQVSNNKEYSIERLSLLNLSDLNTLYADVYSKQPAHFYFSYKYKTAFTGVQFTAYIAFTKKREPAAFYGVIPCFLLIEGEKVLSAQSADTMTHPSHRNKGLFVELANLTFSLCKKEGIHLLFGFPNQNSAPGFLNKLGWEMTEKLDCYLIKTGALPLHRLYRKLSFLEPAIRRYQHAVLKKYLKNEAVVSNSVLAEGYGGIVRDADFLAYKRYSETLVLELNSSLFWIKLKDALVIGDIQSAPGKMEMSVKKLKKLAFRLGIREIQFHTSPNTSLNKFFADSYKSFPSFPVIFKTLGSELPLTEIKFNTADIDTF